MCKEYNGWSNVFTWKIGLWGLFDDQDTVEQLIDMAAAEAVRWDTIEESKSAIRSHLADAMQMYTEDFLADTCENMNGVVGDLLSSAIGMVDWMELAQHAALDHDEYIDQILAAEAEEETEEQDA